MMLIDIINGRISNLFLGSSKESFVEALLGPTMRHGIVFKKEEKRTLFQISDKLLNLTKMQGYNLYSIS